MPKVRIFIALLIITALGILTYYAEQEKSRKNSVLSGTFENLPTVVSSRTSGRVKTIFAEEGTAVKKGEPLLELDPGPLLTELKALQSRANEARHALQDLQAGYRPEDIAKQKAAVAELQANLAMLEAGSRQQDIEMARAQLAEAEANYAKLRRGPRPELIAQAQARYEASLAALDFAASEDQRYTTLYQSGAVSRQSQELHREQYLQAQTNVTQNREALLELQRGNRQEDIDMAKAQAEKARQQFNELQEGYRSEEKAMAQARLQQAQAQLALMRKGYRPQEIAKAKAALATAELNVKAAEERLQEYIVTAPLDCRVDAKLAAIGDLVNTGTPLMRISDPQDIWIKVYMAQDKLHLVQVGDKAQIAIDGIAEAKEGQVESIASQGEFTPINLQTPEERGRQVFAIKLRLSQPDPAVKAGMAATVKQIGQWSDRS
ncbi:MAG: HlyD family efflux transporter periplasmic adaptor subunit [bacterium]|nr:HlyD family efflux transporter periplasmic adaptor subunit [bacterium]